MTPPAPKPRVEVRVGDVWAWRLTERRIVIGEPDVKEGAAVMWYQQLNALGRPVAVQYDRTDYIVANARLIRRDGKPVEGT